VLDLVSRCCAGAPAYAVPRTFIVASIQEAAANQLLSANGRIRRAAVNDFVRERQVQSAVAV